MEGCESSCETSLSNVCHTDMDVMMIEAKSSEHAVMILQMF